METFVNGLVSVVTPVYNGETYLGGMLKSILNQTYSKIEMILVDDGSEDRTVEIAESFQEKFETRGISFRIVQAEHKNAASALSYGLPYVSGEYLVWPDADDKLEPESIEKRVSFLKCNPQYKCVRSLSYYFDMDTGERTTADEARGDLKNENLFWDILESKTYVCCGCYMIKTEQFFEIYPKKKILIYDVGQNFQMLLPFMYKYECRTLNEELYGVAVRRGSHSRSKLTKEQEEKKYSDYEALIDEIVAICGIKDRKSMKRIKVWKLRRRYRLALKYGRKFYALKCILEVAVYDPKKLKNVCKSIIMILKK